MSDSGHYSPPVNKPLDYDKNHTADPDDPLHGRPYGHCPHHGWPAPLRADGSCDASERCPGAH